jgi:putative addiction module killer protein
MKAMYDIRRYLNEDGKDILQSWLSKLKDRAARIAIDRRINRLELGNFGDHKPCRDGVWELRVDFGPGYRIYYARSGEKVVLLLCGGDKRTQDKDIAKACSYWQDWRRRSENEDESPR